MASLPPSSQLVPIAQHAPVSTRPLRKRHASPLTVSEDGQIQTDVIQRVRKIGGLHRQLQGKAKCFVELVKEVGDQLLQLKQIEGVNWNAVRAYVSERYGLGDRSIQVYVKVSLEWNRVLESGVDFDAMSLRGLQRLLTAPKEKASGPSSLPTIVTEGISEYFDGSIDFFYSVGKGVHPDAFQGCKSSIVDPELTEAGRLSGNVVAYSVDGWHIEILVETITSAAASGHLTEAILLLPPQITAKWSALIDARPRVYVRADRKAGRLMLAGLIDRKRLSRFGAVFSHLGPVHFPYEMLRPQS